MDSTPLDLSPDTTTAPVIRLTAQIIKGAIKLKADGIFLELDKELHLKFLEEWKVIQQSLREKSLNAEQLLSEMGKLTNACEVIYIIGEKRERLPPLNGELFGNVVNILLLASGIPPWTKGEISVPLKTIKPNSKWILESNDVTRRIQLRRIRAN